MSFRLGIDIGGTFTDLVFLGPDGEVLTSKVLSTPDDYSRGIAEGLAAVFAGGRASARGLHQIVHGTTVATNAILEAKGARVGLLTTEGFRDVLEIRRLRMPVLYDIRWRKPAPLVDRERRIEVAERVGADGVVERPMDEAGAREAIAALLRQDVDAVAICLLNAYASGVHEERLAELVAEMAPDLPVCLSSALLPEIKEFERTSTTVVNAYVMPVVAGYLRALTAGLSRLGVAAPLRIMQSSGGAMGVDAACQRPIHLIESGPAAGVVGAAELSRRLGGRSLIAFDMGGTTAKAALVAEGRFDRVGSLEVGGGINVAGRLLSGGGYHVRAPAIDIAEVGTGGGSLVRIDAGGGLRVGPESAGADPGPACYGRGGTGATVTDANVVLGYVNPAYLAGGSIPVDHALAERAIAEAVARPLGIDLAAAAWGVHRVANAAMGRALRAVSTERGHDPRDFAILAFGGNGPIHAAAMAAALDIRRILVPPAPGLFSALGMLFPDTEHHYVRTFKTPLEGLDSTALDAAFAPLVAEAKRALAEDGYAAEAMRFDRHADLRYQGENSELTLPVRADGPPAEVLRADFDVAHEATYGYHSAEEVTEIVNLRLVARGLSSAPRVPDRLGISAALGSRQPSGSRAVYFGPDLGWTDTPIISRAALGEDWQPGPVLVEEYDSTTVVPPQARVRSTVWGVLEIELAKLGGGL